MAEPAARPATADDPVLRAAVAAVRAHYGDRVERIVLFGSRARGDQGPESDYDVAVFLKDLKHGFSEMQALSDIRWRLLEETGQAVQFVPLSRTDRKGTALLQYDIEQEGVPL